MLTKLKDFEECTIEQKVERWQNVIRVLKKLTPHQRRKHLIIRGNL
jgi:hypothetical protein